MEKQSNFEYGHTDPDFIDQNTLVDGTYSNEDQYKKDLKKENNQNLAKAILTITNKTRWLIMTITPEMKIRINIRKNLLRT